MTRRKAPTQKAAKPKALTIPQLKKKVDEWQSKYIRALYADNQGTVECYTCGKRHLVGDAHVGHFISRRHYSTRYEEDNQRPQCVACNIYDQGRQWEFGRRLDQDSPGTAERIYQQSRRGRKWKREELHEMWQHYKTEAVRLQQLKGFSWARTPRARRDRRTEQMGPGDEAVDEAEAQPICEGGQSTNRLSITGEVERADRAAQYAHIHTNRG